MKSVNKTSSHKTIGILGGMGPQATVDLYQKIVNLTPAKKDQDHLHVIIDSYPQIPDRTKALLEKGPNPLPYLIKALKNLEKDDVDFIIIPCNTSHAYLSELQKVTAIPIINMIKETSDYIKFTYPEVKKIGLLATTGTIKTQLYQKEFEKNKHLIITPPDDIQENLVMRSIYGPDGIKAGNLGKNPLEMLISASNHLIKKGAEIIIAGCTEIPLVLKPGHLKVVLVDPTHILAKVSIEKSIE